MDKVTVITVCYNAEAVIKQTMSSVCEQDYLFLEYLIIDGASNDKTLEIAREIEKQYLGKNGLDIAIYSEVDNGIYDAMNKGIDHATGDWIIFLNAGDFFFDKKTISCVFQKPIEDDVSGIFGDTERFCGKWKKTIPGRNLSFIKTELPLPFCHQSVFVRNRVLKKMRFNASYKQAGDYDLFVRCFLEGCRFVHVDLIISKYAMGGISETNTIFHLKEKLQIRTANGLQYYSWLEKNLIIFRLQLRQWIKKIMPPFMLKKIRGY